MMTLIELEERVRLLTEENINLRKQVLDYAKKINKQKCVMKKLKESLQKEIDRTNKLIAENSRMITMNNIRQILNGDREIWLAMLEMESDKNE